MDNIKNKKTKSISSVIKNTWAIAKDKAGDRYTPELNVDFSLFDYFSAATLDANFYKNFKSLKNNINEKSSKIYSKRIIDFGVCKIGEYQYLKKLLSKLLLLIDEKIEEEENIPSKVNIFRLDNAADKLTTYLEKIIEKSNEIRREDSELTVNSEKHEHFHYDLLRFQGIIRDVSSFSKGGLLKNANNPYIFVSGEAGSGKTHLLCEFVRKKIEEEKKPAILLLGEWFSSPFKSVEDILSKVTYIDKKNLLKTLNRYGIKNKTRLLICIDAINEGHRHSWEKHITTFLNNVKKYPGLALIVSCRTPFDNTIIPELENTDFIHTRHTGYSEEEQSDAMKKYFTKYSIPFPEIPLLNPEFLNPLFLKLFCEALENATVKHKHKQIQEISSGQKGMTYILEFLVREKSKLIASRTGIRFHTIWKMIKDGLATEMASKKKDTLRTREAKKIINSYQPPGFKRNLLFNELIHENILSEDMVFFRKKYRDIVRFTYQRFSNHLVARYLLKQMGSRKSKKSIETALKDKAILGRYFSSPKKRNAYYDYGVITALMVEFPTRINNKGELMDFLDWKGLPFEFCRSFIEGLYWRDPKMINQSTKRWIGLFLNNPSLKNEMLNVVLALSVKPKHPLNAKVLGRYLSKMTLTERDLFWTEFYRNGLFRDTPNNIIQWGFNLIKGKTSKIYVKNYLDVLSWFLTTTQRGNRDKITKLLFLFGIKYPDLLFKKTLDYLEVNDSYVSERLLAATYGVILSLANSKSKNYKEKVLPEFAKSLFELFFNVQSPKGTTHILSRYYAKGIIEMALLFNGKLLDPKEKKLIEPPYSQGGIRNWNEEKDKDKNAYRDGNAPLHMDFENYTLGRLVPNRGNYDYKNKDFIKIKENILWRIYQLGYSLKKFSEIDKIISRSNYRHELRGNESIKIDRYGKKYSWIAFYELCGYLHDEGLLKSNPGERISDADIDPSFPEIISYPKLTLTSSISHTGSLEDWIKNGKNPDVDYLLQRNRIGNEKGEWIVLEGFNEDLKDNKRIFSFFRGLIVKNANVKKIVKAISDMEYPGNHKIPQAESQYYSFAGELGHINTWNHREYPATITTDKGEIEVEIPVTQYSWESYHSSENNAGGVNFPSIEIMNELKLFVQTPKLIVKEKITGKKVFLSIRSGEFHKGQESFSYMSSKFLDKYLDSQKSKLVIVVWGEREPSSYDDPEFEKIRNGKYSRHEMIHKQIYLYEPNFSKPQKIF